MNPEECPASRCSHKELNNCSVCWCPFYPCNEEITGGRLLACCGLCSYWDRDKEERRIGICTMLADRGVKKLMTFTTDRCKYADGNIWDCTDCHGIHKLKSIDYPVIGIMELIDDEVRHWKDSR